MDWENLINENWEDYNVRALCWSGCVYGTYQLFGYCTTYVFRSECIYSFQHMYMKWYLHIDVNQKNGKQSTLAIYRHAFA